MLHLIAALDRPTSGMIRADGADLAALKDLPRYRRHHIGLVFTFTTCCRSSARSRASRWRCSAPD